MRFDFSINFRATLQLPSYTSSLSTRQHSHPPCHGALLLTALPPTPPWCAVAHSTPTHLTMLLVRQCSDLYIGESSDLYIVIDWKDWDGHTQIEREREREKERDRDGDTLLYK
ncbi:hypothetical protein FHG87_004257 [Trinorchestia longiramus]|nr:hypothetical protein FHG87_004257 [Trinorchestia longiramus]